MRPAVEPHPSALSSSSSFCSSFLFFLLSFPTPGPPPSGACSGTFTPRSPKWCGGSFLRKRGALTGREALRLRLLGPPLPLQRATLATEHVTGAPLCAVCCVPVAPLEFRQPGTRRRRNLLHCALPSAAHRKKNLLHDHKKMQDRLSNLFRELGHEDVHNLLRVVACFSDAPTNDTTRSNNTTDGGTRTATLRPHHHENAKSASKPAAPPKESLQGTAEEEGERFGVDGLVASELRQREGSSSTSAGAGHPHLHRQWRGLLKDAGPLSSCPVRLLA